MRKLINCLYLGLAANALNAQNLGPAVVATAGETFSTNSLYVEWTVGELMIESFSGSLTLTQGFHQSDLQVTSIGDRGKELGEVKVYPNPTQGSLIIQRENGGELSVAVLDLRGGLLFQRNLPSSQSQLDLSHLPSGIYLVRVSSGNRAIQSFRVQKM